MTTVTQKLITAEEFARMPNLEDGSQQELLRGVIITMPPPKGRHGICCAKVARLVGNFVDAQHLGHVTCNDAGFISERNPDSVRGPDVAFWNSQRVSEVPQGYFEVPPDLAVEVVSPSDSHSRVQEKLRHYLKHGVRLVWVVDPELRIATVYRSSDLGRTFEEADSLAGEDILPGFTCRVADLFG
jgi:Uma2 family endonuclease